MSEQPGVIGARSGFTPPADALDRAETPAMLRFTASAEQLAAALDGAVQSGLADAPIPAARPAALTETALDAAIQSALANSDLFAGQPGWLSIQAVAEHAGDLRTSARARQAILRTADAVAFDGPVKAMTIAACDLIEAVSARIAARLGRDSVLGVKVMRRLARSARAHADQLRGVVSPRAADHSGTEYRAHDEYGRDVLAMFTDDRSTCRLVCDRRPAPPDGPEFRVQARWSPEHSWQDSPVYLSESAARDTFAGLAASMAGTTRDAGAPGDATAVSEQRSLLAQEPRGHGLRPEPVDPATVPVAWQPGHSGDIAYVLSTYGFDRPPAHHLAFDSPAAVIAHIAALEAVADGGFQPATHLDGSLYGTVITRWDGTPVSASEVMTDLQAAQGASNSEGWRYAGAVQASVLEAIIQRQEGDRGPARPAAAAAGRVETAAPGGEAMRVAGLRYRQLFGEPPLALSDHLTIHYNQHQEAATAFESATTGGSDLLVTATLGAGRLALAHPDATSAFTAYHDLLRGRSAPGMDALSLTVADRETLTVQFTQSLAVAASPRFCGALALGARYEAADPADRALHDDLCLGVLDHHLGQAALASGQPATIADAGRIWADHLALEPSPGVLAALDQRLPTSSAARRPASARFMDAANARLMASMSGDLTAASRQHQAAQMPGPASHAPTHAR